jgi:hypothetical protein
MQAPMCSPKRRAPLTAIWPAVTAMLEHKPDGGEAGEDAEGRGGSGGRKLVHHPRCHPNSDAQRKLVLTIWNYAVIGAPHSQDESSQAYEKK